jgi:PAS domain S-box-containing protein
VWVVDHPGRIAFANPAACNALGYGDPAELRGKPSHQTVHYKRPDGTPYPEAECPMLRPRRTGETVHSEDEWFIRRDGSMFPIAWWSAPIDMPGGRGAVLAFTDITERLASEQALRERDAAEIRADESEAAQRRILEIADRLRLLAEQQAALRRVATLVARGVEPAEIFAAVTDELRGCLHAQTAGLWCFETGGELKLLAAAAEPALLAKWPVGTRTPVEGDNLASVVLRTGQPARMDNYENAAGAIATRVRELGVRAAVGVPVIVDGRLWGLAAVGSVGPGPMATDTEARIGDFAELVATAIAAASTRADLIASRARIVTAGDEARRRLERDLHDGAQQRLVSLGLKLRLAEQLALPEQPALMGHLSEVVSGLTGVLHDLQEISRGIHPAILSEGGLGPALKTLARRCSVPVNLDVAVERRPPDSVEVAAYYVVAEALTNAAKYAHASQVNVYAETKDAALYLSIQDDGIGGADSRKGSGLIGLKDRVEVLGGHMKIVSPPGSGTSLHITIPVAS